MNIKHICFDLDGTLVKSDTTIYKATLKTLEHLNIKGEIAEDKFIEMIGMHFVDIFEKFTSSSFVKIKSNDSEVELLSSLRDLLLPKLLQVYF